ncbi:hypothetical protein M1534_02015 [Patescibacteria group bacterium]|jgi:hypothetical protein|nr:hypothetical protein [Patescibacteria group bacterium]
MNRIKRYSTLAYTAVAGAAYYVASMGLAHADLGSPPVNVNPYQASNQFNSLGNIYGTVKIAINWVFAFGGIIAVALLVYGGVLYMQAQGNEDQSKKAKAIIRDAIIGLIIMLLAYTIITLVIGTLAPSGSLTLPTQ